ncbi:MAG: hypothetical protein RL518_2467 [Pseudomonadota bacterium]|jgi:flagellar assembly protein FliH
MTTEEQQATRDPLRPNVRTFKPSTFRISEFQIVGDGNAATQFAPEQFAVIHAPGRAVDPMFDVYDDLVATETFLEQVPAEDSAPAIEDEVSAASAQVGQRSIGDAEADSSANDADDSQGAALLETTNEQSNQEGESSAPSVVSTSELEQLQKNWDEERLALQAQHEQQLEEVKSALQQEFSAQLAQESDAKIRAIEERYRTIIDDMQGQIRQEVDAVERRAVEFAMQVARKLVGTIVDINPEYILQVIKEAIALTGGATIKAIRVSPQDLEFIKMLSPERQFKEFDGSWSFRADDTIRAGCVLETSSGEVEFDLEKAWERIKESVTKVR